MESIVQGTVIHGDQQGQALGFPTANLSTPASNIEPICGVYRGTATITESNTSHVCAVIIRKRNNEKALEVHLLDFNEDLYGKQIIVSTKDFIREWYPISNQNDLIKQITQDIEKIKELEREQ